MTFILKRQYCTFSNKKEKWHNEEVNTIYCFFSVQNCHDYACPQTWSKSCRATTKYTHPKKIILELEVKLRVLHTYF